MADAGATRFPVIRAPKGACDCHMHLYGPFDRFPLPEGVSAVPEYSYSAYVILRQRLGITRTVYVQPSAYLDDNRCMLDAIARDGDAARGVAVLKPDAPESAFRHLGDHGVRGLRFHEMEGCLLKLEHLRDLAPRIAPLGWHAQVQFDGDVLPDVESLLSSLPVEIVVDHMGRIPVDGGVDRPAFRVLLRLLETGRCWVKMSAPYHVSRSGRPGYEDCAARARAMIETAPHRLVWATNWPHPSVPVNKPHDADMLDVLASWVDDPAVLNAILADNAARLYGFER